MKWHLVCESTDQIVASGTHREMWEAWRKNPQDHYVASFESGPTNTAIGGTRETPKGIRSAGMFPGVKKCIRHCTSRRDRQQTRLMLRQMICTL